MKTRSRRGAIFAVLILLIPACRHRPPTELPVMPYSLTLPDRERHDDKTSTPDPTKTLGLEEAIRYALETDSRIATLLDRSKREMADITAIHADSPEIRVGYEEGEQSERGWSRSVSTTRRSSSGTELTTGTGSQESKSTQTGFTDYGDFFDPDQTSTETTRGSESSEFRETQSSSSSSTEKEIQTELDYSKQQEEGMSLELRLSPANPWALHAEREAARAATSLAEAELLEEEHGLACDVVEYAIRLHYFRKMAVTQRAFTGRAQSVHDKLLGALSSGSLASEDYASGCRVIAAAVASSHRLQAKIDELEQLFREVTGLDPRQVTIEDIEQAAVIPFPLPDSITQDSDIVSTLMETHTAILLADWNLKRSEAEWDLARIANYPWASHVGVGYAWSEGESFSSSDFTSEGNETSSSSSISHETQTDWSESSSTEFETPSGDVTTQSETGTQTGTTRSQSSGSEQERSSSSGTQTAGDDYDGSEWWVEVGIEIPIFDWLSGETRARRRVASSASETYDRVSSRVHQQILNAITAARRSNDELQTSRIQFEKQLPALKELAASAWRQGLTGELESLQIEEDVVEMLNLVVDCSMREALTRLDVVRAAGTAPSLAQIP